MKQCCKNSCEATWRTFRWLQTSSKPLEWPFEEEPFSNAEKKHTIASIAYYRLHTVILTSCHGLPHPADKLAAFLTAKLSEVLHIFTVNVLQSLWRVNHRWVQLTDRLCHVLLDGRSIPLFSSSFNLPSADFFHGKHFFRYIFAVVAWVHLFKFFSTRLRYDNPTSSHKHTHKYNTYMQPAGLSI